jgi:anti-sigma factor RsiW
MTCRELVDFLMAYLDRELAQDQHDRFERHLTECPACVVYMNAYVETIRMGKMACSPLDSPVTEDIPEEFVRAILAAKGGERD